MTILGSRFSTEASTLALRRRFWAAIFTKAIEHNRRACGLSIEDAAWLAGMEASEWAAIEAGMVPQTMAQLLSIAGPLEIGHERLFNLVLLCRDAWEQ